MPTSDAEDDVRQATANVFAILRRESLDVYNRLHSIAEDARFVECVHRTYPHLPIIPNLRCGAWYVDPTIAAREDAYFKSTDGHFGNWSFNLRRPNVHLLPRIAEQNGIILVDSTRAGKRLPDALSKTVPIWCAVINRALLILHPEKRAKWETELYCPPGAVSEQERSQICRRVDAWADALSTSSYLLPDLPAPLRPMWLTPATSVFPSLPRVEDALPVVCVSASKQIAEGVERRSGGFSYVQGSGDDHELWSMGLTPGLFWTHKDALLKSDRAELPARISELVSRSSAPRANADWKSPPTPIHKVRGRILIGAVPDMPTSNLAPSDGPVAHLVISSRAPPAPPEGAHILHLQLQEGKKDQLSFLQNVLPRAVEFAQRHLEAGRAVCICCDTGKDASVGAALAALQLFDDAGELLADTGAKARAPSKESIRTRLQWIIASRPQANPARATLKRVNEFLLSPPALRRERRA